MLVTTRSKANEEYVFKENKKCYRLGERKMVEEINGGNNSTDSENTNPNKRMEQNLVGSTKYYSCGST
jgi:hypothetical protein